MEIKKKPLPKMPTKKQLFAMYHKLGSTQIKPELYAAQMKYRNKAYDEIKNVHTLYHPEFVELVKLFGIPDGYYAEEDFFNVP